MNELQIFNSSDFGEIRTISLNNEPWFVGTDICKALDLSNATVALSRLDPDEVTKFNLGSLSGITNCVNEYGLYNLILASRKPKAKAFKRWITHEVLPSLRNNGGYIVEQDIMDEKQLMAKALQVASKITDEKQRQIEEMKPKYDFANAILASDRAITVGTLAKIINEKLGVEIGQNRLFDYLRCTGYLIKRRGNNYNAPTQRSIEQGLFEIKENLVKHTTFEEIKPQAMVTPKGQQYFIDKFRVLGNDYKRYIVA